MNKYFVLIIFSLFMFSCGKSEREKMLERAKENEIRRDEVLSHVTEELCIKNAHTIIKKYTGSDFNDCMVERIAYLDKCEVKCKGWFKYTCDGIPGDKYFELDMTINPEKTQKYYIDDLVIKDWELKSTLCSYDRTKGRLILSSWKEGDYIYLENKTIEVGKIGSHYIAFYTHQKISKSILMDIIKNEKCPEKKVVNVYTYADMENEYLHVDIQENKISIMDYDKNKKYKPVKSGDRWDFEVIYSF